MIIMTKLNSSSLEQLGEIFYAKPEIVSKQIEGNQFITIVFDEKKVEKGFGMTTFAGRHIIPMMKLIEGTHFVNSITTTVHKTKLQTEILICENTAREE
jgi:hypothetical protein